MRKALLLLLLSSFSLSRDPTTAATYLNLIQSQSKFSEDVGKLLLYIHSLGYLVTLGEAYRTQDQADIYAKQGKGIRNSFHCKRLAIDLEVFTLDGTFLHDSKDYERFGKYWKSLDPLNRWGGDFKTGKAVVVDGNHFERHYVVGGK